MIECVNFHPLIGAKVYLDASKLDDGDKGWMTFALRRAMARQGVLTVEDKKDAQVIMEAAVGEYGTDEVDYRLTTPGTIPLLPLPVSTTTVTGGNALVRKNRQDAVVKLASPRTTRPRTASFGNQARSSTGRPSTATSSAPTNSPATPPCPRTRDIQAQGILKPNGAPARIPRISSEACNPRR